MQAVYHWLPGLGTKTPTPMPHEHDEMACSKHRPTLNLAAPGLLKRARSATLTSPHSSELLPSKRQKTESELPSELPREEQALPAAQEHLASPNLPSTANSSGQITSSPRHHDNHVHTTAPSALVAPEASNHLGHSFPGSAGKMDPTKRQRAQEKIRSQLDLEILLKNDELRLIEQELGKVYIALEQLRRCRQIPFPGDPGSLLTHGQTVNGTGPAIIPPKGSSRPAHPAPWGVTDGPYSRHYAQWLLPDPEFDVESVPVPRQSTSGKSAPSSGLRGNNDGGSSHRRQRHSTGGKTQASAIDYPPPPKEKAPHGPQILRRPDGQLVKLKCKDCGKEDVSSVQGFLNHCRIAHQNDMKSHAEAANICGVPVDGPELVQTPTSSEPTNIPSSLQRSQGQVHPLNNPLLPVATNSFFTEKTTVSRSSADLLRQMSPIKPASWNRRGSVGRVVPSMPSTPVAKTSVSSLGGSAFVPSPLTPSLSALAQKSGDGGTRNLAQLVANAKQRINLDDVQPLIPDSEAEDESVAPNDNLPQPQRNNIASNSSAQTSRAPVSGVRVPSKPPTIEVPVGDRPQNNVSKSQPAFNALSPSSSPHALSHVNALSPFTVVSHGDTQMTDLSPRTNPPGLVTDHEDDEDMEDEAKSVVEHPSATQNHVRIYGDHGDLDIAGVPAESKELHPHWHSNVATGQSTVSTPARQSEKKRRGRPKKGKEKVKK